MAIKHQVTSRKVRKGTSTMTTHKTGTREQWLMARLDLLKTEKELTRRSDELARQRQDLPWVPINKGYRFETDGEAPRWQTFSVDARSSSSTTLCSGLTSPRAVPLARLSQTASTASLYTSPIMT